MPLAIAIKRNWVLLSGDSFLREAAKQEKIACHGSIWIYDQLLKEKKITEKCYKNSLKELLEQVKLGIRRLPIEELERRIK